MNSIRIRLHTPATLLWTMKKINKKNPKKATPNTQKVIKINTQLSSGVIKTADMSIKRVRVEPHRTFFLTNLSPNIPST